MLDQHRSAVSPECLLALLSLFGWTIPTHAGQTSAAANDESASRGGTKIPLQVQVRDIHGTPTLHINGKPHTGLTFFTSYPTSAKTQVTEFAGAGINLLSSYLFTDQWWKGARTYDFTRLDEQIAAARAANPQVLLLLRLNLNPPAWWRKAHPEEMMRHYNPITKEYRLDEEQVAFTSERWKQDMANVLRAVIAHTEKLYGDVVLGYVLTAGATDEWSYTWRLELSEFSKPQQIAYRAWLQNRYATDAALQAAWADEKVRLETATIPIDRATTATELPLLNPATDRRLIDYQQFHSEVAAESLIRVCEMAKTILREQGRQKVIGAFYGYHFFIPFVPTLINSGHAALARVLESPAVDFLVAPYSYMERHPGGIFLPQPPAGSLRLHGKLLYIEDDTRTFKTEPDASWGRCPDRATTIGVLRRNWLGTLGGGGTLWWMEQGEGWFSDAELLADLGAMQRITAARLQDPKPSHAQVAVITSEESVAYLRYDDILHDPLIARQMVHLMHLGAPADIYLTSDLKRVFSKPDANRYRLVVFLDTLFLKPEDREVIRTQVARQGRTLLWIYGSGIVTNEGWSIEAMTALTGIRHQLQKVVAPLYLETAVTGTRMTYGSDRVSGPVLVGDDPEAEVWGWLVGSPKPHDLAMPGSLYTAPGLLVKQLRESRSVWSALPALPDSLLRHIARQAGVHVYNDLGAQVMAAGDLLAVHANLNASHRIHLPAVATVTDAFTNKVLARNTTELTLPLSRGETAVWKVMFTRSTTR